jgi:acetolactate synthase regulatory subunit
MENHRGEFVKGINGNEDKDGRYLEVDFTINGYKIKFSKFIELVGEQWERMVKDEAIEMIKEQFSDFYEKIDETGEDIKAAMLRTAKEHGIEIREDDRW